MFNIKSSRNIVATICVKNEEDIIGSNIEYHINHGVTHFIITDNNSTDRTRNIIERYPEVVEIIEEKEEDHNQSKWVTKMARMACKLNPDWIIHLDADEFWCGIGELKFIENKYIANKNMYLHPPVGCDFDFSKMQYYPFFNIQKLHNECKVAHRPDPDVVITHGNHGFEGNVEISWPYKISRHHYPVRSYKQFVRKSVDGHKALQKRGSVCERWKKWHDLYQENLLEDNYKSICNSWINFIKNKNKDDLLNIVNFWCEPEVAAYIDKNNIMPEVKSWNNNK